MRFHHKLMIVSLLAVGSVCMPASAQSLPGSAMEQPAGEQGGKYENESFRNIAVTKTGPGQYAVKGEARVFEATVRFVVTDEGTTLADSFVTASQGAPEWGTFTINLSLDATKLKAPVLTLFEESAESGQRIHELNIPLPK
ncbi:Gmad2 immunoglobulin-like domain-containing protein [Brevibacillus gelatini]|uniref:Gmad2 immunoglobulin-like domain-containing protein n=1 Tax=Brevibacillus gelatini TaxID=1655277 RepID=UPI003D819C1E